MVTRLDKSSPPRRKYDSSRRQAEARARQRRVIDAARELFLVQGYGATSIEQIARTADVSVQSVYASFDGKAGILKRVVDVAIAGDDEDVAVIDRPELQALLAERDMGQRLREMARLAQVSHSRSARLLHLVDSAAGTDPALAELAAGYVRGGRQDARTFARSFPAGVLRDGFTTDDLADLLYVVGAAHTWITLVEECGWSPERYESWLVELVSRMALVS